MDAHLRTSARRPTTRRLLTLGAATLGALLPALPAAAQEAGAGGASAEEVIISSITAVLFLLGAAGFAFAHRRGKLPQLDRAADATGRLTGQPGWAALPLGIAGVSLIIAVTGFYWDVATHIDHGRDEGVFGNAAHWPILIGLTGIAIAGLVSMLLGVGEDDRRTGAWRPQRFGWRPVPVGGALLFLCGVIALIGFPIDDVWHRIFGQDVTLWSPPHIQMVFGASLCTIAMWVLFVEAERVTPLAQQRRRRHYFVEAALAGATLVGLSTLQGEFDFGVPQFRLLFQPLLIAVAAGISLVAARIRLGRGGALLAVGFFLALRVALTLLVSGALDHVTFHVPLYLGAALVVELVALAVPARRQLTFGALAGLGIGTVGLAVEAAWSQIAMPFPWTASLLPEAAVLGIPAAVAAGVAGGFLGRALARPGWTRQSAPVWLAPVAGVVIAVALAWPLPTTGVDAEAQLSLQPVAAPAGSVGGDHVEVTVTVDPPDLVEDPEWFNVIAWQGAHWWSEEATRNYPLEDLGDGVYRTTDPIPVHGEWKALVRLHEQRILAAVPIFLPEDPAIPAEEVPAESEVTRAFVPDHELLLREARETEPWVPIAAQTFMGVIAAAWLAAFVVGTRHVRRTRPDEHDLGADTTTSPRTPVA